MKRGPDTGSSGVEKPAKKGEKEKGEAILRAVAQDCAEYLTWMAALSKNQKQGLPSQSTQKAPILGFVIQQADRYGLNELVNDYSSVYMQNAR